ncbi:MAG: hypothetical protein D6702_04270 [Planctomycetota bacterium]|nr:MAG: hypothetical protein D6702_04270 [Planctomycetota bacterium]
MHLRFALPATTLALALLAAVPLPAQIPVDGRCNIFGAGHAVPPDPGGGGPGLPPVEIAVPETAGILTLSASGMVGCCGPNGPMNPPDGGASYDTSILGWDGIAGIAMTGRQMALVGVFVGPDEPRDPTPPGLSFVSIDFAELRPELRQPFFIGDGSNSTGLQLFHVPPGATRLFLGFADSRSFQGLPGWFDDNVGRVDVTGIAFTPRSYRLEMSSLAGGQVGSASVLGGSPGATQYLVMSRFGLGVTGVPALGVDLALGQPRLLRSGPADPAGTIGWTGTVPAGAAGRTLYFQAAESGQVTNVIIRTVL